MQQRFWVDRPLEIVVTGPTARQSLALPQPFALIGSHADCDVVVPDPALPRRCFAICLTAVGLVGAAVAECSSPQRFRRLDRRRGIRLGSHRITFPDPIAEDESGAAAGPGRSLRIAWDGQDGSSSAKLRAGRAILFGRRSPSVITIDDRSVSTVHGFLYPDQESLWVIDLSSTNGTRVDGKPVRCGRIPAGGCFQVGTKQIEFRCDPARRPRSIVVPPAEALPNPELERWIERCTLAEQQAEQLGQQLASAQQDRQQLTDHIHTFESQLRDFGAQQLALGRQQDTLHQEMIAGVESQGEWLDQVTRCERMLSERQAQLESEATKLDDERAAWKRELQAAQNEWTEQREREQQDLEMQRQDLAQHYAHVNEALDRRDAELKVTAEQLRGQGESIEADRESLRRDQELLVVGRIRVQRFLRRREHELQARETALDQLQQSLESDAERLEQLRRSIEKMRQPSKPKASHVSKTDPDRPRKMPHAAQAATAQAPDPPVPTHSSVELASPLFESPEFTHLVNQVIGRGAINPSPCIDGEAGLDSRTIRSKPVDHPGT